MAFTAILSGSTLGFFSSVLGWLFFGLTGWQAMSLYLGLGLFIPIAGIALAAIHSGRAKPQASTQLTQSHPQTA